MPVKDVAYFDTITAEAVEHQLDDWQQRYPQMGVLAYLPEQELSRLPPLQALFRDKSLPLAGGVFPAIIVEGRFCTQGVLLFCFEQMPRYLIQEDIAQDGPQLLQQTTALAEKIIEQLDDGEATLFLLFDAMLPNIGQILEGLYLELADRVHYMGVNAGSEHFQPMPCLFDADHTFQNGLLALLLPNHHGAILEHGYGVPERLIAATSTEGNRIINIDWRPAFEVYAEHVKAQFGVEITAENFYRYGVHFPFGIIRADHEVLVRIPVALMEDGSLFCVGEIPPNAILTLLEAPQGNPQQIAELLANHLDKAPVDTVQSFYCAGRRLHLGIEAAQTELDALEKRLGQQHVYGALSLGEIGSSRRGGYPLFHNAALIISGI